MHTTAATSVSDGHVLAAVSLDIDHLQDKMLRHRRGGCCFEHNLLFAALRSDWASMCAGTSGVFCRPPRMHTSRARTSPSTSTQKTRHGTRDDHTWRLRSLGPDGWSDRYAYTQERQHLIDCVAASHDTATHTESHFTRKPVAVRIAPEARYQLNGLELTSATPDGTTEHHQLTGDDVIDVLQDTFGIDLDPVDVERLLSQGTS